MRELLMKLSIIEKEMETAHDKAEYWREKEHLDLEKADRYEVESDILYEKAYKIYNQLAENIVSLTIGRIDKVTAMIMVRQRREDIERILL